MNTYVTKKILISLVMQINVKHLLFIKYLRYVYYVFKLTFDCIIGITSKNQTIR